MSDGTKLYYEKYGKGETLVFCHGLNSSHSANKEFYDEFKNDFNIVIYDQRGHADSDKSKVHLNVQRLGQDLKEIIEYLMELGVTIETIINCKKMKKGIGKIGTVIIIVIMIVAGFFFFFVAAAGIFFYLCGMQRTPNGIQ